MTPPLPQATNPTTATTNKHHPQTNGRAALTHFLAAVTFG
jgi:hypothetical protein